MLKGQQSQPPSDGLGPEGVDASNKSYLDTMCVAVLTCLMNQVDDDASNNGGIACGGSLSPY